MAGKPEVSVVELVDGQGYRFARLPVSAALLRKFGESLRGDGDATLEDVKELDRLIRTSLKLAGYSKDEVGEIELLVDVADREVCQAVMAAMFRRELLPGGDAAAASEGVVREGVGDGPR